METHLHLPRLPSPPRCNKVSPWTTKDGTTFINPTTPLHVFPFSIKRTQKLHAHGKGFGVAVSDKKPSPKEDGSNSKEEQDDAIPQVVFDRMMRRVVLSVGTPMASSIVLLYVMSFLKERSIWDVPGWLPFLTILLGFGSSALGIAYGTLSSSWDPNREGSVLGWEEAQKNWPELNASPSWVCRNEVWLLGSSHCSLDHPMI